MPLITLITDLGTRDHYSGVVKGELLKAIPDALIVDISHEIEPFNIIHGSFVLKNSYRHFPEGSYHLIGVNTQDEAGMPFLIVMKEEYVFIGPDNGLFGLLWDGELPEEIYRIHLEEEERKSTLPMKDVYVRAVKHLSRGGNPQQIGERVTSIRLSAMGRPITGPNNIRGSVIYFDRFENAIVNVTKDQFDHIRQGRDFVCYFKRYDDLDTVSESYFSVPESEKLLLFNSNGYLEIAINKGNAMGLLNLNIGDIVQIEFK